MPTPLQKGSAMSEIKSELLKWNVPSENEDEEPILQSDDEYEDSDFGKFQVTVNKIAYDKAIQILIDNPDIRGVILVANACFESEDSNHDLECPKINVTRYDFGKDGVEELHFVLEFNIYPRYYSGLFRCNLYDHWLVAE